MTADGYDAPRQLRVLEAVARLRRRALAERRWSTATIGLGCLIIGGIVVFSLAAPLVGFDNPNEGDLSVVLRGPSAEHWFGTDAIGRDVFTRVLYAARVDLLFGVVTTVIPLVLGLVVGAIAGYFGGFLDTVIGRLADVVIAFPFIVLVLAIVAIVGPGLTGAYIGVIVVGWALYARLTRGEMLVARERQYVLAARTLGFRTSRVIFRHALPNLLRPSLVFAMADIVLNILFLTALSYLGLGVEAPTAEWGTIIFDGQAYLLNAWWISTLPGLVVVLVGVGFILVGDGLADRLGEDFTVLR